MSEHPETAALARLIELAALYGVEEIEVEQDDLRLRLEARSIAVDGSDPPPGSTYLWHPPVWPEAAGGTARSETAVPVLAPLTGTFYRAPNPDTPNFVEVGDVVEEGQVVGLIEAMKIFSNITAGRGGRVVEIAAQNGRIVQHGDPLLYVEP